MAIEITRKMGFDAGHRVLNHEGKCRHLHGHRYTVELTVKAPDLDELGRVIDFSCLKKEVGGWIDNCLDHNMLLHPDDPLLHLCTLETDKAYMTRNIIGRDPFIMPDGYKNPTAENISAVIASAAKVFLNPRQIDVVRVRLWETPNCFADWTPGE